MKTLRDGDDKEKKPRDSMGRKLIAHTPEIPRNNVKRVEFLLKAIVKVEFWDGLDNCHLVARMSLVWGKSYKQVNFKGGKKRNLHIEIRFGSQ